MRLGEFGQRWQEARQSFATAGGGDQQLRRGVLDGSVSATWLVSASVADLATEALKQCRKRGVSIMKAMS